jgi:hypothetical protein
MCVLVVTCSGGHDAGSFVNVFVLDRSVELVSTWRFVRKMQSREFMRRWGQCTRGQGRPRLKALVFDIMV